MSITSCATIFPTVIVRRADREVGGSKSRKSGNRGSVEAEIGDIFLLVYLNVQVSGGYPGRTALLVETIVFGLWKMTEGTS
jgi:hypothetical protein